MKRAAAILLAAVAAGAGCGGGHDEADDVRAAVRAYVSAFVRGDGARTCALMTAQTQAQFVKGARPLARTDDCAQAALAVRAAAGSKAIAAMRAARISDVQVNGKSATAKLTASSGQSIATLTKERGRWKVSSTLGGSQ